MSALSRLVASAAARLGGAGHHLRRRARPFAGHDARWHRSFSATDGGDGEDDDADTAGDGDDTGEDAPSIEASDEGADDDAGDDDGEANPASEKAVSFQTEDIKDTAEDGEEIQLVAVVPDDPNVYDAQEKKGWLFDLTEQGHTLDWNPNIRNAHLSDRAKTQMYVMHRKDPSTWDVPSLAERYKIRQQRVMAILALKTIQHDTVKAGGPTFPHLEAAFEQIHGAEHIGSGERHVRVVPSLPNFAVVPAGTPEHELRDILPKFRTDEERAANEEKELVKQFKSALEYNTGVAGPGLNRRGRFKHPTGRPKGGYGLLVVPQVANDGKKAHAKARREGRSMKPPKPYVAYADGTKREINEDEQVMLRRRKALPFRRLQ